MFDINDPAGGSGVTIQLILNGENATQQFQQFASQIEEKLNQFNKQVEKTNTLLTSAFSVTKITNFSKKIDDLTAKIRNLNNELNNISTDKLAAVSGAPVSGAAKAEATKTGSAQATKLATSNKQLVDSYTQSFNRSFFQMMDKGFTQHTIAGTQSLIKTFGTAASWIGRIRVLAQSAVKMVMNLIKSPFTLISGLLQKVSNAMGSIFKAFEWIQYQLFMQFMNIWLFSKTLMPVIQTFIDYNREIYQTWALIRNEWGHAFDEFKINLESIDLSVVTDEAIYLGEMLDDILGKKRDASFVKMLSTLGTTIAMEFGKIPQDVASAFYQMASATMKFEDIADTAVLAAKVSTAGVTDLTTAMDAGIQAAYAFGIDMSNLNDIYDLQFQTVKYGILRYKELADVMGRVYQPAASLSESLANMQEMYATIAFATRVGLSPEMAGFGMGRLYESFSDVRVVNNLKKINVEVFDSIGNFRGLYAIVNDIVFTIKGFSTSVSQTILSNLGFDMRARRVLRSLITNFAAYTELVDNFGNDIEGSMNRAFETMTESFAFKVDQFKATWETLKISISEASIDTLNTFIDNLSFGLKAMIGWLQEGIVYIGKFEASVGTIVKYSATFFMLFAVIASFAGIIRAALTPTGLFVASIIMLLRDAAKGGKIIQYLNMNFKGLATILNTVTDYIKIFLQLLKTADTPISAFGKVLNMMFSDLNSIIFGDGGIASLKSIIDAFKALFTSLKGIFDPSSYIEALDAFSSETGKFTTKIGTIIAYRFGNIFHSVGQAMKDFIVTAFDIDEGSTGTVLGTAIQKTYSFIMQVFAGIFNKSPEEFGLMKLFSSILEAFGILVQDKFSSLVLNPHLISSIGSAFAKLLGEAIKAYFTNFNLVLTITGFNIAKEATYGLFRSLSAMQTKMIESQTFAGKAMSFVGDTLKYRAVLEFVTVLLPPDLADKLKGPVGEVIKWGIALFLGAVTTASRVLITAKSVGKALTTAIKAATVTIHTPVVNIFTTSVNNTGVPASPFVPVTGKAAAALSKTFIVSMMGIAVGALAGVGGLAAGLFGDDKKSPIQQLTAQMEMQALSNNAISNSLKEVSASINKSTRSTSDVWKTVGLITGGALVAGALALSSGTIAPLLAAIGVKGAASGSALALLGAGSLAISTNLPPFLPSKSSVKPESALDFVSLNKQLQSSYIESYARELVKAGELKPEYTSIIEDIIESLPVDRTVSVIDDKLIDKEYLNKLKDPFLKKLIFNYAGIAEAVGIENYNVLDLTDDIWSKNTIRQLDEISSKYWGNLDILRKFRPIDWVKDKKDLDKTVIEYLEYAYGDVGELITNIMGSVQVPEESAVNKYKNALMKLDRFYGTSTVLSQFEDIPITKGVDLDKIFNTISSNLEKYSLSLLDKDNYLKTVNRLYINYFSDIVKTLDDTDNEFKSMLAKDPRIIEAFKKTITPTLQGGQTVTDVLNQMPLTQILEELMRFGANEDLAVQMEAKSALQDVFNILQGYAGDLIDVTDYLEFFKLMNVIDNYLNFEVGKSLKEVYDLKNMIINLAMPTESSMREVQAINKMLDGITEIADNTFSVSYWENILNKELKSTATTYATKAIAETIATTIVNAILESMDTQAGVKALGLGNIYSADTGIFMSGTKYAASFKDPYTTFSEYAVSQFAAAMGGQSKILDMTSDELLDNVKAFVAKTFPTEGLEDQKHIENFNRAMQNFTANLASTENFTADLLAEFENLAKIYFSDDLAKFIEGFGKVFAELDIMARSKEYTEAFELMFDTSIENVMGALASQEDLANVVISAAKEIQDSINAARRGLVSTRSVMSLAFEGAEMFNTLRDFKATYNVYSAIVGGLFGRSSMLAGLYDDLAVGFATGMNMLRSEAKSYDFSKEVDLSDFISANANLLIDLGIITQEQYLKTVAPGMWEGEGSKPSLTRNAMKLKLEDTLATVGDQYASFVTRQMYFLTELGGITENSLAKMDVPEMLDRVKGIADNLVYWFENDVIGLFNPANWESVISSGVDFSTIITTIALTTKDNLLAIFSDPKLFKLNYKNIFEELIPQSIAGRFAIEQDVMDRALEYVLANEPISLVVAGGLRGLNRAEARAALEQKLKDDAAFKSYIDINVAAIEEIQLTIKDELVSNLQTLGKGLISQYIPEGLNIFDTILKIPILGGGLNILTGIVSNLVGNYLLSLLTDKSTGWLMQLTAALESLNIGATGEQILTNEELVNLSKNIILDGFTFIGSLLKLPFEIFSGKANLEGFIGRLNFETLMPNTVGFINQLGGESSKIISEFVVGGIKGVDILQPIRNLLAKYEALDDKTETSARKLVEEQWVALKDFTADVLGVKQWVVNLLDIGLFRGGIIDFIAGMLPVFSKIEGDIQANTNYQNRSSLDTLYASGTPTGKLPGSIEAFLAEADATIMTAIAYRMDNLIPLKIVDIQNEVVEIMTRHPDYTTEVKSEGVARITRDKIREQATVLSDTLSNFVVTIGEDTLSGITIYNALMSGIIKETDTFKIGENFLYNTISSASTSNEAVNKIKETLREAAGTMTPEARARLKSFSNTFMTSMLPTLTPKDIQKLFPAEIIPSEYLNTKGEWKDLNAQFRYLFEVLDPEQIQQAVEFLNGKMQSFYDNLNAVGSSFTSMGNSLQIATDEFGWGMETIAKAMKSVGIIATSTETVVSGLKGIDYWGAEFSMAAGGADIMASITSMLGLAGGWGQVIGGVLQGFVALKQLWQESQKLTEQQLIAIRQNTVALESMTNILDSMRLTMYGAPSGFMYGYSTPLESSGFEEQRAPIGGTKTAAPIVTVNINGNVYSTEDVTQVVEEAVKRSYKRYR